MTKKEKENLEAIERLKELVKPGDTISCILRHVSRSGMQREISALRCANGHTDHLDFLFSKIYDGRIGKHGGVVVGGCDMDMGFHLVSYVSWETFRDAYALKHQWL